MYAEATPQVPGRHRLPVSRLTNEPGDRLFFLDEPGRPGQLVSRLRRVCRRHWTSGCRRLAGVRVVYVFPDYGAGHEQCPRGGSAVQHDRPAELADIRAGSQRPDELRRPTAQRPAPRLSHERRRSPAVARHHRRCEPATVQRPAVGRHRAGAAPQSRPGNGS